MDLTDLNFKELVAEYVDKIYVKTPGILLGVLTFLLFTIIGLFIKSIIRKIIYKRAKDKLLSIFISKFTYWVILVIGFTVSLKFMGFGDVAGSILAGAGIGAFVIGYAFRDIGENFLSGIMLAFSRPFQVGDTIETNGVIGKVVSLDLRNVQLKSFDGKDIFIPNGGLVKNNLTNHTIDGFMRYSLTFGIGYESDITATLKIIRDQLPKFKTILQIEGRLPVVTIGELTASSLNLTINYWIDTFDPKITNAKAKEDITITILDILTKANINLPGDVIELKSYHNSPVDVNNVKKA